MIKKRSLQFKLTAIAAILLTISCIIVYAFISNSALMRMDTLESDVMNITLFADETHIGQGVNMNMVSFFPDLEQSLAIAKHEFRIQCLIVTIIVIVVGTALTWFISGLALRPLKDLTERVGEITANNLSEALPVSGSGDEVDELTTSFNTMLNRLDGAFLSQRQFVANAAHELRTPLAVMQTNLEVCEKKSSDDIATYKEVLDTTLHQTEQLGNLTNTLLELMSLHTATLTDEIELSGLIAEIFCDLAPIADAKQIEVSQSGPEITIKGNEVLIYHVFYNLIENAIKYNHEKGAVSANVDVAADKVTVSIKDTGEGINPDQWEQIFEPFYRVDKARSRSMGGAGLGLALVSDIVSLHSGNVYVKESSNDGTTICVELSCC